ncbi:hypothetical protein PIB30_105850 [Stylosanthes scabra]|uniref:Uncharacterized protein n=1 Tax=Stylosanthes scabra TaxID=79078 RepID=A0ABU6Z030_9FABA|nr:hypothetical protein [Stylosanthes scabra]
MPRMKKTTKRARGESSVEPPPWNHPLARYFASNEDLVYYEMRLAGRKEIPPRKLVEVLGFFAYGHESSIVLALISQMKRLSMCHHKVALTSVFFARWEEEQMRKVKKIKKKHLRKLKNKPVLP